MRTVAKESLLKLDPTGSVVYQYKNAGGGYCDQFAVMGSRLNIFVHSQPEKDKETKLSWFVWMIRENLIT